MSGHFQCIVLSIIIFSVCQANETCHIQKDVLEQMIIQRLAQIDSSNQALLSKAKKPQAQYQAYLKISNSYSQMKRKQGIEAARKALKISYTLDQQRQIRALGKLAWLYKDYGHPDSCRHYLEEAEKLMSKAAIPHQYYLVKGHYYKRVGDLPNALQNFLAAAHSTPPNVEGRIFQHNFTAKLYQDRGEYRKALPYLQEAKLLLEEKALQGNVSALLNMGESYARLGIIDSAIITYEIVRSALSGSIGRSHVTPLRISYYLVACAQIAALQGRYVDNIKIGKNILFLFQYLEMYRFLTRIRIMIANSYFKVQDYESALIQLEKAELEATQHHIKVNLLEIYKLMSDCHDALNRKDQALIALQKFNAFDDELHKGRASEDLFAIEMELIKAVSTAQISALEQQKETIETRMSTWKVLVLVMIFLSLVLTGGLYFFRKKLRSQHVTMKQVLKNKTEIERTLEQRDTLLKEIHHRVKNNLQFISSLLSLQADQINDKDIASALKSGQERVHSMALIHQNLYQNEDLKTVEIKEYLHKLIANLFDSYNIRPEHISLDLQVDSLDLSEESVVPIGLIVNELVSNALKYAFPKENQKGQIQVEVRQLPDQLRLSVKDNGIGMNREVQTSLGSGFGYQLVASLCQQIEADLKVTSASSSQGTEVTISIPQQRLAVA